MKLIEKDGMRILYPKYGYLLRNTTTNDIYSGKVYLSTNSSPEDFEEVRDESIDDILIETIDNVESKEESLNKIGKLVANQVTDDAVALSIQEFYDIWQPNTLYTVGRYITHNGILYKVLIEHTSLDGWTPDIAPSIFARVLIDPTGETISEWIRPDSTNAYMTGDKVRFEGIVYMSLIDNNVWSPTEYPAGWQIVED